MVENQLDKPIKGSEPIWQNPVENWVVKIASQFRRISSLDIWSASWVWVPLAAFLITRIGIGLVAYISQGILVE
jgi:hypothetical protein